MSVKAYVPRNLQDSGMIEADGSFPFECETFVNSWDFSETARKLSEAMALLATIANGGPGVDDKHEMWGSEDMMQAAQEFLDDGRRCECGYGCPPFDGCRHD